jgi:DNA-directed RNA polymerase specialized sigma subunit
MSAAKQSRSSRITSTHAELPSQFHTGRASDETVAALHARYQATGSDADRDALASIFLGQVTMMAINRKMRWPHAELDELISDGCLGVMRIISKFGDLPLDRFRRMIFGAIKIAFSAGVAERMWAGGKKLDARDNRTMLQIRSMFLKQHGRMPTGEEIRAALNQMIDNGQIEKEFTRANMIPASVAADEDGVDLLAQLGADGHVGPVYETISRETMKIALRGLKGTDRTIFKCAIEGMNPREIGERVNLNTATVYKRVNGLLWAARCRADLAAHLGAEAATSIPLNAYGRPVQISQVPPARKVG